MGHAWCRDVDRDERVRAAEDGRGGPLPTLGECIAAVTERMSADARGDKTSHGLRTERITLEITHDGKYGPVAQWPWRCGDEGKSVRVVSDNETDAEMLRHAFAKSEIERLKAQARVAELEQSIMLCSGSCGFAGRSTQAASGGGEGEMSRAGQIESLDGTNVPKCTERDNLAASGGGERAE